MNIVALKTFLTVVDLGNLNKAAELAAKEPNTAAIGSALAADIYGLHQLFENIARQFGERRTQGRKLSRCFRPRQQRHRRSSAQCTGQ